MSISVAPLGSFGSKLSLNAAELPKLDAEFEEITEGEELTKKEKLKKKWAALEALVGDPKRIALVAADLVAHIEKRVEAMIVCMIRDDVSFFQALQAALNKQSSKNEKTPEQVSDVSSNRKRRAQIWPITTRAIRRGSIILPHQVCSHWQARDRSRETRKPDRSHVVGRSQTPLCRLSD